MINELNTFENRPRNHSRLSQEDERLFKAKIHQQPNRVYVIHSNSGLIKRMNHKRGIGGRC